MVPADAHVWFASIRRPPATVDELRALLSSDERARLERYRRSRDRRRFAVGRGVLRRLLGEWTGREPRALRLATAPGGKPRLAGPAADPLADPHRTRSAPTAPLPAAEPVGFSVSYSHDLVAIAVGPAPLGIDVEWLDPTFPWHLVAPEAGLPRMQLFRAWTRAEARFKAGAEGVPLIDLSPAPGYVATVATNHPVRIRGWA